MRDVASIASSICFIFLIGTMDVYADSGWKSAESRGYFVYETMILDFDELNSSLRNQGYGSLNNNTAGFGLGGYDILKNNLLWGGHFSINFPFDRRSISGVTSYIWGGTGDYFIGYLAYKKERLRLCPCFGISFAQFRMILEEKDKRDFDDTLAKPNESIVDTETLFAFNIGTECNWILKRKADEGENKRYTGLSFRIGYRIPFGSSGWKNVSGGPDLKLSGPYLNISYGGGKI